MSDPLPCLRRTEPSAALIPRAGQRTLAYVPAEQSDIRRRMHEFNRSIEAPLEPIAQRVTGQEDWEHQNASIERLASASAYAAAVSYAGKTSRTCFQDPKPAPCEAIK